MADNITVGVRPSFGSLVLGRQLHRRIVASFQRHGTKGRSSTVVSQSRHKSKRGSGACSRPASIITTGAGCWIRAALLCPQSSRGLPVAQDDVSAASMAATVMEKEAARASAASPKKVSTSTRNTKSRPEACEKCLLGLILPGIRW